MKNSSHEMIQVRATADQRARNGSGADSEQIRDIRKYVFAIYTHNVLKIAGRLGSNYTDCVDNLNPF